MLLEQYRNVGLRAVYFLTLINVLFFVGIFAIPELFDRFLVLLLMFVASGISLEFCNQVVRIEPITALHSEWTDTQIIEALFQKPTLPDKKEIDSTLLISQLPLANYIFLGETRIENRKKFMNAFYLRYPDLQVYDREELSTKERFTGIISERKSIAGAKQFPVIFLTDLYDAKMASLPSINIYVFLESATDQPVNFKVVDNAIAKELHPVDGEKITLGLWDSSKGKLNQLRG